MKSFFADGADFNSAVGFRTATPKRLRFFLDRHPQDLMPCIRREGRRKYNLKSFFLLIGACFIIPLGFRNFLRSSFSIKLQGFLWLRESKDPHFLVSYKGSFGFVTVKILIF